MHNEKDGVGPCSPRVVRTTLINGAVSHHRIARDQALEAALSPEYLKAGGNGRGAFSERT